MGDHRFKFSQTSAGRFGTQPPRTAPELKVNLPACNLPATWERLGVLGTSVRTSVLHLQKKKVTQKQTPWVSTARSPPARYLSQATRRGMQVFLHFSGLYLLGLLISRYRVGAKNTGSSFHAEKGHGRQAL